MTPYPLSPTTGTIQADKIVGRNKEINHLKKLLKGQSIILDDIRRMGKTLLLMKFAYLSIRNNEPNKAIYFIFQGTPDVNALTDVLLNELRRRENYGWLKVQMDRCHELYKKFAGAKAGIKYNDVEFSFSLPAFEGKWNDTFQACIEDLADHQSDKNETLTLIFDELPIMLWEWINDGKAADAMAFLDLLRSIHYSLKDSNRIRFVFCGSIGLEVVLAKLKREFKYTGEPFNYTRKYHLPPMGEEDAKFLCNCLYLSDFICDDESLKSLYFESIINECNNLPYFINAIFSIIQIEHDGILSEQTVKEAIRTIQTDNGSTFDVFKQLDDRLSTYYPDTAKVMRSCLNVLAKSRVSLSEEIIKQQLSFDEDDTHIALETLWRDEMLTRTFDENENRHYQFKYNLIKQWWKLNKA